MNKQQVKASKNLMTILTDMANKIFMYEALYGKMEDEYQGVNVIESFMRYKTDTKERDAFVTHIEKEVARLVDSKEVK